MAASTISCSIAKKQKAQQKKRNDRSKCSNYDLRKEMQINSKVGATDFVENNELTKKSQAKK